MPRFFVKRESIDEESIRISGDDAYHIARSLRMAVGDLVTVCDAEGTEYSCTLTKIRDEECECAIIGRGSSESELPVSVTLFMAYPKGDKLETVIQKAVELGAKRIVPFESSRCIKKPKAEKAEKQLQRLERIATEAAKQSGRGILPEVCPTLSFKEMLTEAKKSDAAIFCYESERETSLGGILNRLKDGDSIAVIVGSEGGFSPEEADEAIAAGCHSVTLGKRILRCETAPLFALSAIGYHFELR